jgi:glycosyltransferase involved in cell wall biosynthesis
MESILQQDTRFEYEVIVVNDGSTDTTAVLLGQYEQDKRVRVIHQQNGGLSAARNTGIAVSKGEYLCFVDSDDALAPGALDAFMMTALHENAKLVIGSYERCCADGTIQYTKILADQKATNLNLPGFAHGRVIHYSAFRTLCFPERYWFEDSIMAQIVHPLFQTSAYTISHVCYRYFVNETGITSSAKGKRKSLDSLWITMRLLEERKAFQLPYTQHSYGYFLSMVNLTYHRTKALGPEVAKCVFSVQRMLMDKYYADYWYEGGGKKRKIEEALRSNNFRKYVLACERKR